MTEARRYGPNKVTLAEIVNNRYYSETMRELARELLNRGTDERIRLEAQLEELRRHFVPMSKEQYRRHYAELKAKLKACS